MPIRDDIEPEQPQADTGLLEFIDRRRLRQVRARRQRTLATATTVLALVAIALAVSNVILIRRLSARPEVPAPASVASTPVASTPEPSAADNRPPIAAPAQPAMSVTPSVAPTPSVTPAPSVTPPSSVASVPRAAPGPITQAPEPSPAASAEAGGDPAQRTARWLVQTHGRVEAENRAARVAEFYSGEERAFWRRVLRNLRQEAEP